MSPRLLLSSLSLFLLIGCGAPDNAPMFDGDTQEATAAEEDHGEVDETAKEEMAGNQEDGEVPGDEQEDEGSTTLLLRPDSAELSFVAVKNGDAEVPFTATELSGALVMQNHDLSTIQGSVTVNLSGIGSENEVRDERVRNVFFSAAQHSEIVFTLSELTLDGGVEGPWAVQATGSLAVSGQTIELPVSMRLAKDEDGN